MKEDEIVEIYGKAFLVCLVCFCLFIMFTAPSLRNNNGAAEPVEAEISVSKKLNLEARARVATIAERIDASSKAIQKGNKRIARAKETVARAAKQSNNAMEIIGECEAILSEVEKQE